MKNDAMQRRAGGVKLSSIIFCVTVLVAGLPARGRAQVNSGSNGSDGAFNPTANTNINMASRLSGIYQYTSVNIASGVTVTFTPNANNTPVVWLVQSNCIIAGTVSVAGGNCSYIPYQSYSSVGGGGGPGGWGGGSAGTYPSPGQGPGGGGGCATNSAAGGSFGSQGQSPGPWAAAGTVYGNSFLLPLLGGSGGGAWGYGGGGGGGAILIAASGSIQLNGSIGANGGLGGTYSSTGSGGGSGGGVRLVTASFAGNGSIDTSGGTGAFGATGGNGRIRIDAYQNTFGGGLYGAVSQGFQPIILPTAGQGAQLTISSVAGVAVSPSPSGVLSTPDAVVSAQQVNPLPVVVNCSNIPLNTPITVSVKPATGATVTGVGYNNTGTLASSTATVSLNMPRGGGLIWATAATGN